MKARDLQKELSEETHTLVEFLHLYNENLPALFPRVSAELLAKFRSTHPSFFKSHDAWSLAFHRKEVMDWLQINNLYKS